MQPLASDDLKSIEFDILCEFDRICSKHGLTYFLAYGTLLGAIRHHGFIPWDDDIDVFMPRADYERFYELSQNLENGRYKLTSYRNRSSIHQFLKLIDTHTLVYEKFLKRSFPSGVWIDVFPLETVRGEDDLTRKLKTLNSLFTKKEIAVGNPAVAVSMPALIAKRLLAPLGRMFDPYDIARQMDEEAREANVPLASEDQHPQFVSLVDASVVSRLPIDCYLPVATATFEGRSFPVPAQPERALEAWYGDWRKLPPETERIPHFSEAYRLEEGEFANA